MVIGIDGNEANVAHRVGIGQYAYELLLGLGEVIGKGERIRVYLKDKELPDMPPATDSWEYRVFGPGKLWTATGLQARLASEKLAGTAPDVFFSLTHYAPLVVPMPLVISIMDMSFERFPSLFKASDRYQLQYWTRWSAVRAARILTISEFSKEEICEIYGFSKDKVVVTYPGYDRERFSEKVKDQRLKIKKVLQKYKIKGKYIVYLGTVQPRKNLVRLIEAFAGLAQQDLQLVAIGMISEGRGGWMYQDIFDAVRRLGLDKRVVFTGYVPDLDVPYLFAGSEAYVLPSLYEGYGIPPVEAMATGVPVIVSKVASLPEICGEAPIYIEDPYSVASIRMALESFLALPRTEVTRRVGLGVKWVKRYNWKETAKKTLETLYEASKR